MLMWPNTLRRLRDGLRARLGIIPTTVPTDWRMPVSAAYDSAASSTLISGMAASSTAKTLPEYTVAVGATRTVALRLPAGGAGFIYYQHSGNPANVVVTAAVSADTTNGLTDGNWTALTAGLRGSSVASADSEAKKNFNGQWVSYPASVVERVVRMTVAVSGSATGASTIRIGTFQRLAKMDSILVCSMSIYAIALHGDDMRTKAIADFPTRDPITFNWSVSGSTSSEHLTGATEALAADMPISAMVCAVGMNGSQGSFASKTTTTLNNNLRNPQRSIKAACDAAGIAYYLQRESWRSRGDVNQYNNAVIDPLILELSPSVYDAAYAIGRGDTYTPIRENPALLTDGVHPGATGETFFRQAFFDAPYRAFIGLSFPEAYVSRSVGTAETNATVKASAKTTYDTALANVADLPASAGKTALAARLAAINATVLFYEAVRLIDEAAGNPTTGTKETAQTALNAAQAAGYAGTVAPNTIAAQQERLTAITVSSFDQIVQFRFGSSGAVTGWNANDVTDATHTANALDNAGNATGIRLVLSRNTGFMNSGTQASGPSTMPDFPDAILDAYIGSSSVRFFATLSGLDPAKSYDISTANARVTASSNNTRVRARAGNASTTLTAATQLVLATNNTTTQLNFNAITPNAAGEIVVEFFYGTGTSFAYLSGLVVKRRA